MNAKGRMGPANHAQWPSTFWTQIREMQASSNGARAPLLDALVRRYWPPLHAFFKAQGVSHHFAEDLVQGFLGEFLEKDKLRQVDRSKGRFRDLFMVSARRYMISRLRKERTQRRGGDRQMQSFDAAGVANRVSQECAPSQRGSDAFVDAWKRGILDQAQQAVIQECRRRERTIDFLVFRDYYLTDGDERRTWSKIAERYGVQDWKKATRMADWVKERFRRAIRQEIRYYVQDESEVDDEIRDLL